VSSDEGMPNWMKQSKAASHIRELLIQRGVDIPSRTVTINGQKWTVFEHGERQIGIDVTSGIWLRESDESEWRLVATEHTMSGAFLAIDFLTKD
jgi:hypothetical protein